MGREGRHNIGALSARYRVWSQGLVSITLVNYLFLASR